MTDIPSRMKGDRIVESLERGEHWFTQHRVKIAIFTGAFIIAAFVSQYYQNQNKEAQAALWNEASKLTTSQQKIDFVSANPSAEATPFLMLQTSRQLLDEGKFAEAEATISQFIAEHTSHPKVSSALMVRGYAREEQGETEGARADYQKVQGMEDQVNQLLATEALARLP
jgi:Flp pilus assembly protein TadD